MRRLGRIAHEKLDAEGQVDRRFVELADPVAQSTVVRLQLAEQPQKVQRTEEQDLRLEAAAVELDENEGVHQVA